MLFIIYIYKYFKATDCQDLTEFIHEKMKKKQNVKGKGMKK